MGIACWKSAGIWVCTTPRSAKSSSRQSHKLIIQDLTACLSLWDRAEFALAKNRLLFLSDQRVESPSLLKGLIFDDAGNRMSPSHGRKGKRRYRYYISQAILQHRKEEAGSLPRLPAHDLEKLVADTVRKSLANDGRTRIVAARFEGLDEGERHWFLRQIVRRVIVAKNRVQITIDPSQANNSADGENPTETKNSDSGHATLEVPFEIIRRGGSTRIVMNETTSPMSDGPNPALIKGVARAHLWRQQLLSGEARSISDIASREGVTGRYVSRILRLGFLAPDIIEAILSGTHPPDLSLEQFRNPIPLDWADQHRRFGFLPA